MELVEMSPLFSVAGLTPDRNSVYAAFRAKVKRCTDFIRDELNRNLSRSRRVKLDRWVKLLNLIRI